MNKDGNTATRATASLECSSEISWEFHPHGTVLSDAMVRMSQTEEPRDPCCKCTETMVLDGDPGSCVIRARLSEIAGYLLQDVSKRIQCLLPGTLTIQKRANVLPATFPNLSQWGSRISAGYATDIPHNLLKSLMMLVYMINLSSAAR